MRALAWYLAAALALAGCKEDKPKPPAPALPPATPGEMKDKATETADQVKDKAQTAADKAKAALEAAKDKVQEAGELAKDKAAEALTDTETVRAALERLEGRMKKGIEDMESASSTEARDAAGAALAKLVEEKQKLEDRLTELKAEEQKTGKDGKGAKAP